MALPLLSYLFFMQMPMVQIRPMRMCMVQPIVRVHMAVPKPARVFYMHVFVMPVAMAMPVLVLIFRMLVAMFMPLACQ